MSSRLINPQFAVIAASSSGNTQIVALDATKMIRVIAYNYVVNGAVNVSWRSGTTTVIGGVGYWGEQGRGKVVPYNPDGWFQTAPGEALYVNLSTNVAIGGELTYVLIPF